MPEATPFPTVVRFGAFEVDLRSGELRKRGLKVRLQERPFQILTFLLENRGEVVTREELRKRLWPADTFVDFDHSVNTAVNKLREALGDSAENPHFIETLPRHGYRFMGMVESGAAFRNGRESVTPPAHRKSRRWLIVTAAAAIAVFGALFTLNVGGMRNRLLSSARTGPGTLPKIESIAVLPFENLSGDPAQEYFADGMTEELITELGKIGGLRVISRTSVMRYKGTKKSLPEIGRELNVDAIVEAAVLRSTDQVRITAKLVGTNPERQLWAASYERDLRDVLSLQDEVARAVASQIRIRLTPQEYARLATTHPINAEAHRLCLLGRFYWNKRNDEGLKNAVDQFQRAIEVDPTYAPAYAGLADSYLQLANNGVRPPNECMPKAKAAAQKALQIDPSLAQAHTSLAEIYKDYDWNWAASEREFKRAIELNPNYATAHQWYAEYLTAMRRHTEAIAEAQRAEQLDPLSPIIRVGAAMFGGYFYARQYNEGIRHLRETVSMFPEFGATYWNLGDAYAARGMDQEAFVVYRKAESLSGARPAELAALEKAYAKDGLRGFYLWKIQRLREESKHRYVRPYILALYAAAAGEKDQAFSYLEKGYEAREWALNTLQVNPSFDPLRSDPRFQALVRRMNFPP